MTNNLTRGQRVDAGGLHRIVNRNLHPERQRQPVRTRCRLQATIPIIRELIAISLLSEIRGGLAPCESLASARKIPVRDQELVRRAAMEERRMARRYKIPVAVEVSRPSKATESDSIHVKTHDISSGGLYLNCNQRIAVGTRIALSLTLSLSNNGMEAVVDCKAKVVRVEENPDARTGNFGIAVVIDSYNFVRPKSAT